MLGGPDSFSDGKYDRTPVGEMLPVYLNKPALAPPSRAESEYRLVLTREGWLQPWVRTRKTEEEEKQRLDTMSRIPDAQPGRQHQAGGVGPLRGPRPLGGLAPGARGPVVRQGARRGPDDRRPLALGAPRLDPAESDLDRSWRQTVRWLVGDVPGRVEVSVKPKPEAASSAVEVSVRVRDAEYRPLDNAKVALKVALPGGGEPDPRRRARRPRGRHLFSHLRRPAGRALPGRRHRDRPRRQRRRRPAMPAGPPSPPPTNSPGSSPTATTSRASPPGPAARSSTATASTRSSPVSPRRTPRSPSPGPRPSGTTRSTSSSPSPPSGASGASGESTAWRDFSLKPTSRMGRGSKRAPA